MDVRIPLAFSLALALSGAATAQNLTEVGQGLSPVGFRNHALPVLVRVNSHGHVTDIQPAVQLRPDMRKMLRKTLEQMIVKPAMHKGRAVSSQFVMQLALETDKRPDGKYNVHFAYVSSMPVPMAPLHWVRTDDHRLALAMPPAADSFSSYASRWRSASHVDRPVYYPQVTPGGPSVGSPAVQTITPASAGNPVASPRPR